MSDEPGPSGPIPDQLPPIRIDPTPSAGTDSPVPTASATSTRNISGGIEFTGGQTNFAGDGVGRDKVVINAAEGTIIQLGGGKAELRPPLREVLARRWRLFAVVLLVGIGSVVLLMLRVPPCDEVVPIIRSFTVYYPDNTTQSFGPDAVIEIISGEQLRIEAVIPEKSAAQCTWSAGKGLSTSDGGCSILYSPPVDETNDALNVVAESPCRERETKSYANLLIKVVQSRSQP